MDRVDIVNQSDQIIDQQPRSLAHQQGLIHRTIAIFVWHKDKLIVQPRTKHPKKLDHSAGGHVDAGETYHQAAVRELYEELQVNTPLNHVAHFLADELFTGDQVRHMFTLYQTTLPDDWQFKPTEEVRAIAYYSIQEITKQMTQSPWLYTGGFIFSMHHYLQHTDSDIQLNLFSLINRYRQ